MKNSFDRIITSTPVNKTAAIVAHGKGESWEPKRKITQLHWDAPPKCKPLPRGQIDRAGSTVGRLTVISYYGSKTKGSSQWLVRCVCGAYETRTSRSLDNLNNASDCCNKCRALNDARSRYGTNRGRETSVKSSEPLPVKPYTPNGFIAEDLTGKTAGLLTVVGCSPIKGGPGSKWVVRCTCGIHEIRTGKYLRRAITENLVESGTMCDDCGKRAEKRIKLAVGMA